MAFVNTNARTKVVVRRLPPTVSEEELKAAVDAVCQGKYDWFNLVKGKESSKRTVPARAYINLIKAADVWNFSSQFTGRSFSSATGVESKCVVEYAPYQKVATAPGKADARESTWEKDTDFQAFKENFERPPEPGISAEAVLEEKEREIRKALYATGGEKLPEAVKVTPLMQYLQDKHAAKQAKSAFISRDTNKKREQDATQAGTVPDKPPHLLSKEQQQQLAKQQQQQGKGKREVATAEGGATGEESSSSKKKGNKGRSKGDSNGPAKKGMSILDPVTGMPLSLADTDAADAEGSVTTTPKVLLVRRQGSGSGVHSGPATDSSAAAAAAQAAAAAVADSSQLQSTAHPSVPPQNQASATAAEQSGQPAKPARPVKVRPGFQAFVARSKRGDGEPSPSKPASTAKPSQQEDSPPPRVPRNQRTPVQSPAAATVRRDTARGQKAARAAEDVPPHMQKRQGSGESIAKARAAVAAAMSPLSSSHLIDPDPDAATGSTSAAAGSTSAATELTSAATGSASAVTGFTFAAVGATDSTAHPGAASAAQSDRTRPRHRRRQAKTHVQQPSGPIVNDNGGGGLDAEAGSSIQPTADTPSKPRVITAIKQRRPPL